MFDALGFRWDRLAIPDALPTYSVERVCFHAHRLRPELAWQAGVLHGNPLSFAEVQTVLDGFPVAGRAMTDQDQIRAFGEGWRRLLRLVREHRFSLSLETIEALQGHPIEHRQIFRDGIAALATCAPMERALVFFLLGVLQSPQTMQTWFLMLNGALLSKGFEPISLPATRAQAFNNALTCFAVSWDGSDVIAMLLEHPQR